MSANVPERPSDTTIRGADAWLRPPDLRGNLVRCARALEHFARKAAQPATDVRDLATALLLADPASDSGSAGDRLDDLARGFRHARRVAETPGAASAADSVAAILTTHLDANARRSPLLAGWLHEACTDLERARLDARIGRGHRIASGADLAMKTQSFTEPWMAAWLAQNTIVARLPERVRARLPPTWRAFLVAGSAAEGAPFQRVLDPACGAGHLLAIALDHLVIADLAAGVPRDEAVVWAAARLVGAEIDPVVAGLAEATLVRAAAAWHPGVVGAVDIRDPGTDPALAQDGFLVAEADGGAWSDLIAPHPAQLALANPPFLSSRKMAMPGIDARFPRARADVYACFVERLVASLDADGALGLVAQHGWMFLRRFAAFRAWLLDRMSLDAVAHLGRGGGFEAWADHDKVMQSALSVASPQTGSEASRTTAWFRLDGLGNRDKARALLAPPTHRRAVADLEVVPERPLVYWWSDARLERFRHGVPLGELGAIAQGIATADNARFVRRPWELPHGAIHAVPVDATDDPRNGEWVPYVKGAAGKRWIEPLDHALRFRDDGAALRDSKRAVLRNRDRWFEAGVSFSYIGAEFGAREHRFRSVCDVAGSAIYGLERGPLVCALNRRAAREILQALNPTVNFQVGDVARLVVEPSPVDEPIMTVLREAMAMREAGREASVEFVRPGGDPWPAARAWAEVMVEEAPDERGRFLFEPLAPTRDDLLSHAFGLAMGRFAPGGGFGDGGDVAGACRAGVLTCHGPGDDLDGPVGAPVRRAWVEGEWSGELRDFVQRKFFADLHMPRYERLPIYLPVGAPGTGVLAWLAIHRFGAATLPRLAAVLGGLDHEAARRLAAEALAIASRGPRRLSDEPRRTADAPFEWVYGDGIEINAAALWPLLHPCWKKPRKVWHRLAARTGRQSLDWSATAQRYFPAPGAELRSPNPGENE